MSVSGSNIGPIVVFLHAAGISRWMWHDITPQLPAVTHVLPDLPGHGESSSISWQSITRSAELVWAELDNAFDQAEMEKRGIHLVGISLGSYVGLAMLAARPKAVSSAVFSGMHAEKMKNAALIKMFAWVMAPFTRLPFMAKQSARMFGLAGEDVNTFAREARKTGLSAIRKTIAQVIDYVLPANLNAITTRILFVAGSKEHETILRSLNVLAANIKYGQAAIAPDLGHGWAGQDPELFAKTVEAHQTASALPQKLRVILEV
ncbi:MAG: alpha/beta hydrolase [Hyphomicrobiales bacterium]